jgi:hypothetical protein
MTEIVNRLRSLLKGNHPKSGSPMLPVTLIRGNAKNTHDYLEMAYAGADYMNARLWAAMLLDSPLYEPPEPFSETNLQNRVGKKYPRCSFLLRETSMPVNSSADHKSTFLVPRFVNTALDISLPVNEILKKRTSGLGRIARWVKSKQLDYECTVSKEAQQEFYYEMYLPFITMRHKDKSLIVTFENVFSSKVEFEIIMVKKNGERIAGAVMHYWDNLPTLGFFGIKIEKMKEINRWRTGFLYYFAVLTAKNRGVQTLHLGGSSAFLKDGIVYTKTSLGARIDEQVPWQNAGTVALTLLDQSDDTKRFLAANPFVFIGHDGKLEAAIWFPPEKRSDPDEIKNQIGFAAKLGFKEVNLFGPGRNLKALQREFPEIVLKGSC